MGQLSLATAEKEKSIKRNLCKKFNEFDKKN
jgi:hypothetical protein